MQFCSTDSGEGETGHLTLLLLLVNKGVIVRDVHVTRKVGSVTERYNRELKRKYMNAYQNIFKFNVEKLALKFKADGYDTTELEQHMAQHNNMIQNANRYYNEFKTGMDNLSREYVVIVKQKQQDNLPLQGPNL